MRRPHFRNLIAYIFVVIVFFVYISYFYQFKPNDDGSYETLSPKSSLQDRHTPPNPHNFHLMMSNPRMCVDKNVKLLIMVASTAKNFIQRKAIRDTWGKTKEMEALGVRVLFLLANPDDQSIQKKIVEEFRTYGDVIQEDFLESYMNLPLKTVMGIKWAMQHCHVQHIMKTDDDMYVNVKNLVNHMKKAPLKNSFLGCIKQKKSFQPVKSTNGALPPGGHPPFTAGAGYIFSGSLLKKLFEASLQTKIIPVEDVYVSAHLAKKVGAHPPRHDPKFSCGEILVNDCDLKKSYTAHKIAPQRMYIIRKKLTGKDREC